MDVHARMRKQLTVMTMLMMIKATLPLYAWLTAGLTRVDPPETDKGAPPELPSGEDGSSEGPNFRGQGHTPHSVF